MGALRETVGAEPLKQPVKRLLLAYVVMEQMLQRMEGMYRHQRAGKSIAGKLASDEIIGAMR